MKNILTILLLLACVCHAWILEKGIIYPDDDPQIQDLSLKDAPAAGATMSMAFSTLEAAKDAYFRYVINVINEI